MADMTWIVLLIPALPLLGFLLNTFVIRNERQAGLVASGAVRATRARAVEFAQQAERELSSTSSACDAGALRVVLRRAVERDS